MEYENNSEEQKSKTPNIIFNSIFAASVIATLTLIILKLQGTLAIPWPIALSPIIGFTVITLAIIIWSVQEYKRQLRKHYS